MTRLPVALATLLLCVCGAAAKDDRSGAAGAGRLVLDGEPWTGDVLELAFHEDAYVFDDAAAGSPLSREAIAAAVRFDLARLARPARMRAQAAAAYNGRIAWSFGRFLPVGDDGRAYAASRATRGVAAPASFAELRTQTYATIAMIEGR